MINSWPNPYAITALAFRWLTNGNCTWQVAGDRASQHGSGAELYPSALWAGVGGSEWQTSAFPLRGGAGWFMAIKAAIRRAEGLEEGDCIEVALELH